jgi:pimeloyl-ACP methyl ester carboxylesterase
MNKTLKRALFVGAAIAVPALINNAIFARAAALGNPLGGEGRFFPWREGDVFYTHQGQDKPPVVLLHGIYAGASVYEWRKNFDALGEHFTVYALDWLGFGLSDKPNRRYTPELYVEMLTDFIREVVGQPCAVIASSLAAAYAIEATKAAPDIIEHLILISPTGMSSLADDEPSATKDALYGAVTLPILGTSLYNGITARASLRKYLQDVVYFDPSYVTDEMIDHYSTAAHQYGSQYATQSFMGRQLDHSVRQSLPEISPKTLRIVWGREARQTPLTEAEAFLAANPQAELTVIDKAGLLPHDEQASSFNRLVTDLLSGNVAEGEPETAVSDEPAKKPRKRAAKSKTGEQADA